MQIHRALVGVLSAGALALAAIAGSAAHGTAGTGAAGVVGGVPTLAQPEVTASGLVGPDLSALTTMARALATEPHNVVMTTQGSDVHGSVIPGRKASVIAQSSGLEIDEIVDNGQVWVRANLGTDLDSQVGIQPNQWMALDPARIAANNELLIQPDGNDPVDLKGIMTGMTGMQRMDGHHLRGTIDLTKVTGHTLPDPDEVAKAGQEALKVPFTATADPQGRISDFTIDANAFDPALSLHVVYSSYGAADPVVDPTAAIPAPDSLYTVFND
jgi:hypothetical protein